MSGNCNCKEDARHIFVEVLPTNLCPHTEYFVKTGSNVSIVITDENGTPFPITGSGIITDIDINSPNNTITVTQAGNIFSIEVNGDISGGGLIESITFNGTILAIDTLKNVSFSAVVGVTGNLVDNTDPLNPIVSFNPADYDLSQFLNPISNPFVRANDLIIAHNLTTGKQGGNTSLNQFYHTTQAEHTYLTNIVANDTIGTIMNLLVKPTVYVQPSATLTNVTQYAEQGSSLSISLIQTFVKNDAGNKTTETIKKDGVTVSNTNTFSEVLTVGITPTTYTGTVSYLEGITKNNNVGVPDPVGKVLAGTINSAPPRVVTPLLPIFYKPFNTLQNLSTLDFSDMAKENGISTGTITINPNSVDQYIVVAIPSTSTIKTKWFSTELNQGDIGGASNLFNTPMIYNKNSPQGFWGGISYRLYQTNYKSTVAQIQLRNS